MKVLRIKTRAYLSAPQLLIWPAHGCLQNHALAPLALLFTQSICIPSCWQLMLLAPLAFKLFDILLTRHSQTSKLSRFFTIPTCFLSFLLSVPSVSRCSPGTSLLCDCKFDSLPLILSL
ncbi:hypothetical protein HK096_006848 [Nowakowskiella sp. JEL0078]|nr:hypothetical protein HK096_006848 [Nowakowskiella sp. JEL0078]